MNASAVKALASAISASVSFCALFLQLLPTAPVSAAELDVRRFGARCDGMTDDAAAVQRALDAAREGDTVRIPGICAIGAQGIRLSGKSKVTVKGAGPHAGFRSLARTGQRIPMFGPFTLVVDGCRQSAVTGLEFDVRDEDVGALGVTGCTEVTIQDNVIHDVGLLTGGALSASGNHRNRYVGNTIRRTRLVDNDAARGMWLGNWTPESMEWHPYVARNRVSQVMATGIATHSVGLTLVNNVLENNRGSGAKWVPPARPTDQPTLIENNVVRGNGFNGFQLDHAHNAVVRSNRIEGNQGPGIYCWAQAGQEVADTNRNLVIERNTIRNNDQGRSGWHGGIELQTAENILIRENRIEDTRTGSERTQTNGISLWAFAGPIRNVRVYGNILKNHQISAIDIQGLKPVSDVRIAGNTCTGNGWHGLSVTEKTPGSVGTVLLGETVQVVSPARARVVSGEFTLKAVMAPANDFSRNERSPILDQRKDKTPTESRVAGVQWLLDGQPLGPEIRSAPFILPWDTKASPNGEHEIVARVRHSHGHPEDLPGITVTVRNTR